MMNNAAFQNSGAPINALLVNQLVSASNLLGRVWTDKRSRPSLRWLRHQQHIRAIPWIKAGRRVLFCPAHVLSFAGSRLTVLPQRWSRARCDVVQLPAVDTLIDASGLIELLDREFHLKRSLRWVRQQQEDRTLPFIRWGRKVFFSPAQIKAALQFQVNGV